MFAALVLSQCVGPYCPQPVLNPVPVVSVAARLPEGAKHEGDGWYSAPLSPSHRWRLSPVPGAYDLEAGVWQAFDGRGFGPPTSLPPGVSPPVQNFGVTPRQVAEPMFELNGKRVSADTAIGAVMKVPDNSDKRRIVVIGNESDRKAALQQIGKPEWAVVTAHDPDSWYVRQSGFVDTGKPTVYVQEPDGRVLHRQDELTGLQDAIRKADPKYDPAKDPDLRAFAVGKVHWLPLLIAAAAGAVGLLFVKQGYAVYDKRRKEQAAKDELFRKLVEKFNASAGGV